MNFFVVLSLFVCFVHSRMRKSVFETYGGFESSTGASFSVQTTSDGGFVTTGSTYGQYGYATVSGGVLTSKFDSNLTLEWSSLLSGDGNDKGNEIKETTDGDYIICGETDGYALLGKYHVNGGLDWSSKLGVSGFPTIRALSVAETFDGGYILSGSVGMLVAKFFQNGTLESAVTFNDGTIYEIHETTDGGIIGVGCISLDSVLLVRMFSNLSVDWVLEIQGFCGVSVKETKDGYIVTGKTSIITYGGSDIVLAKFFTSGVLDWAVRFGSSQSDRGNEVVCHTNDQREESYIITGQSNKISVKHVILAKFRSNGELEFYIVAGSGYSDEGESLTVTEVGDIVVVGHVKPGSEVLPFISSVGKYGDGCDEWIKNPPGLSYTYITSSLTSEEYFPVITRGPSNSPSLFPFEYVNFPHSFLATNLTNVTKECEDINCFDHFGESKCSSHGTCVEFDHCVCDENYFGEECEVNLCYGIYSNESDVCRGQGKCVDFGICEDCEFDYFGDECENRQPISFWSEISGKDGEECYGHSIVVTSDGGFVITGSRESLSNRRELILLKFFSNLTLEWGREIGGTNDDLGVSMKEISDGGYIVAGLTSSYVGYGAIMILKFGSNGSVEWVWAVVPQDEYMEEDKLSVDELSDGGIIISGVSDDRSVLVKLKSDGQKDWVKEVDAYNTVVESVASCDSGFVVTGSTRSFGVGAPEYYDILLLKVSTLGVLEFAVTLGGSEDDMGHSVLVEDDGSYVVAGGTKNFGAANGNHIVILAKFHPNGQLEWAVTLRSTSWGVRDEYATDVQRTSDNGYVVFGKSDAVGFYAKFDSSGVFEYALELDDDFDFEDSISGDCTNDGGLAVIGSTKGSGSRKVFFAKTYGSLGSGKMTHGCGTEDVTSAFSSQEIYGLVTQSWTDSASPLEIVDGSAAYVVTAIASLVITNVTIEDFNFDDKCFVEYSCFGVINDTDACSGHGDCKYYDECLCEDGGLFYFGDECQYHSCFDILNNETSSVCSGHGECVNHDECVCYENYINTLYKDCSMWDCFGFPKNDSRVCTGENFKNRYPDTGVFSVSHGNCSFFDHCTCEEGYQNSLSCDWDCFGRPSWEDEACGEFGRCIDHDECNCTNSNYTGKYCDVPICANNILEDDVCGGHGDCVSPDVCECDLGYESMTPGHCDSWTCYGVSFDDEKNVCSKHGVCELYNFCNCKNKFQGGNCDSWSCDDVDFKNVGRVCNGHGDCILPEECECNYGYIGKKCQTDMLTVIIGAPVVSVVGVFTISCVILSCCLICCGCCVGLVLIAFCLCYLGMTVFRQKIGLKKFEKLKNFDLYLKEQEMEEDTSVAHIRINMDLFEVEMDEIKLLKVLGEGGSNSTVYSANWNEKIVAFKCFRTRVVCESQHSFDEFEREVTILGSVSHPNIVRFFGCCMNPPRVGIVMEFCENGDLTCYIRDQSKENCGLEYEEKIRICYEIILPMVYLHNRSIIHRDLKLENVLLDQLKTCKLMDFGLSKIVDRMSQIKTRTIGTSYYMAPEVILRGDYDEKIDVFAFAICIFNIMTEDFHPYGVDVMRIEFRVAQNADLRPDLDRISLPSFDNADDDDDDDDDDEQEEEEEEEESWLKETISQCWSHDPEERPSFEELSRSFSKALKKARVRKEKKKEGKTKKGEEEGVLVEERKEDNSSCDDETEKEEKEEEEEEERSVEEYKAENKDLRRKFDEMRDKCERLKERILELKKE